VAGTVADMVSLICFLHFSFLSVTSVFPHGRISVASVRASILSQQGAQPSGDMVSCQPHQCHLSALFVSHISVPHQSSRPRHHHHHQQQHQHHHHHHHHHHQSSRPRRLGLTSVSHRCDISDRHPRLYLAPSAFESAM
jgi:G3E family GTPase